MVGRNARRPEPVEGVHISAMQRLEPYLHLHANFVAAEDAAERAAHEAEERAAQEPAESVEPPESAAEVTAEIPVIVIPTPQSVPTQEPVPTPELVAAPAFAAITATAPAAEVVALPEPSVAFDLEPALESDAKEPAMTPQHEDAPQGLRADLDKAPVDVAAMFDGVAARYDIVNDVLALGQTRVWRNMVVRAINPQPGDRILDLAAGTGTSSAPFAERGAEVVPCDFSLGMLEVGKRRQPSLPFVAGDALNLPFRDNAFDAVTISFGLRNVQDTERALREMLRVTKPGGKIVVCEFSTPVFGPFRTVYMEYLMKALPAIARRTSSNPAAYVYLAESIREWPNQTELAAKLQNAGWERVQWRNATGGIVAIHRGFKPSA